MRNATPVESTNTDVSNSTGPSASRDDDAIAGTGLNPAARRLVLWLGAHPPSGLVGACQVNGFTVVSVAREDLHRTGPHARALVLDAPLSDPHFASRGADVCAQALDHGLAVALVHYHKESRVPLMEQEERVLQYFQAAKALQNAVGLGQVRALYGDWTGVANWARDHQPGPGSNSRLVLGGDVPMDGASELLLRRAFYDLNSVSLDLLTGGKSGARVWVVRPGQSDFSRRAMPFVVKIHTREKMDRERSNWTIVRDGVPPRLYAPLDSERCVQGHALGLVVYAVVDRAVPFRAALATAPDALVRSVFEYTLYGFRASARRDTRRAAAEFGEGRLKALRWSDDLRAAASLARLHAAVPDVDELRAQFEALPAMVFTVATVHGDFHAENLFAAEHSRDVLMIDYGSILRDVPVVADAACLEVSLCFAPTGESASALGTRLPEPWRRAAFEYPLDVTAVSGLSGDAAWLPNAVREIREHARAMDPNPPSYALAVASYLIRFAAYDHAPTRERALAYELACRLVAAAASDLGKAESA